MLPDFPKGYFFSALVPLFIAFVAWDLILKSKKSGQQRIGKALPQVLKQTCIYLDYNATAPTFPEVAEEMMPYVLGSCFGNPSSSHPFGVACKNGLETARKRLAALLNARPSEIIFNSCGSEANILALESCIALGAKKMTDKKLKPHVIASAVEHFSIVKYLDRMKERGDIEDVTYVGVNEEGIVDPREVEASLKKNTVLVTIMHANNEVGSIQPISAIGALCSKHENVLFHSDAAQSVGKIPVKVDQLGVDMLTIAAHKFGGPKGVSALYMKDGIPCDPIILGGPQEGSRRAGTECVPLIAAFGKAAQLADVEGVETAKHMQTMRDMLQDYLFANLPPGTVRVNGPKHSEDRLPNTLSVGFKGVCVTTLKAALDLKVACSAGAACHGSGMSAVLKAMNTPEEFGRGTLRLSLGRHTTEDEVKRAGKIIIEEVKKLLKS